MIYLRSEAQIRLAIKALERPVFAYAYEIIDNRGSANGDGRLSKGEGATLYLTVRNVGRGKSYETQANLRNLAGDGILLGEGRFDISNMAPGDTRRLALTFDVSPEIDEAEVKVELSISDRDLREVASEKIKIPIEEAAKLEAQTGAVKAKDGGASLFEAPSEGARVFGKLGAGVALPVTAKVGELYKVSLPPLREGKGEVRFAFVAAKDVEKGGTPSTEPVPHQDLLTRSPPLVDVTAPSLSTRDGKIKITGTASDNDRVLDSYVFVNARKVFYRSNRGGADPKKMTFELEAPLRPGVNVIRPFARESADTVAAKTIVIRRDGANGELLPTPKGEESPFDGGAEE